MEKKNAKPLNKATELSLLEIIGDVFVDSSRRCLQLRGVNLSGNAKNPAMPLIPSHESESFFVDTPLSFIGRPFPLDEADEHFGRLRHLGFNFFRFNTTWEALEHAGPGEYDDEYIDYVIEVLKKAKEYGFRCFIDPHQDVWSRFSGGSGAPGWTLRIAGLNPYHFAATGAAIVHNTSPQPSQYPKMIWPTNYFKLATATMFTLFFAGEIFAPKCLVPTIDASGKIKDVNIQTFLQDCYVNAVAHMAKRISEAPGLADTVVVGYDTLNEPHQGWLEIHDITELSRNQTLRLGLTPTPFQAMVLGSGLPATIDVYQSTFFGFGKLGSQLIDPAGTSAWTPTRVFSHIKDQSLLEGREYTSGCIWANHGVWDPATAKPLLPTYFANHPGTNKPIDFINEFFKPFVNKFAKAVRVHHPNAVIFIEPPANELPPDWDPKTDVMDRIVYAPHWYDGVTLVTKSWNSWYNVRFLSVKRGIYSSYITGILIGRTGIRQGFVEELALIKREGEEKIGKIPTLIGEIGIPYDMNNKIAYTTNDFSQQIEALDANFHALEQNNLHFTLWNYCPDNTHVWGDNWNGEDLSIWNRVLPNRKATLTPTPTLESITTLQPDTHTPELLNLGMRAIESIARPAALLVPGILKKSGFDFQTKVFRCEYQHSSVESHHARILELYLPLLHYPTKESVKVEVEDGAEFEIDMVNQRTWIRCACEDDIGDQVRIHCVVIRGVVTGKTEKELDDDKEAESICPACTLM